MDPVKKIGRRDKALAHLAKIVIYFFPNIYQFILSRMVPLTEWLCNSFQSNDDLKSKLTENEKGILDGMRSHGYSEFTLQLSYKFLRYNNLVKPNQQWGNVPKETEVQLDDDIERIRHMTNSILSKTPQNLQEDEYRRYLASIETILSRVKSKFENYAELPSERILRCDVDISEISTLNQDLYMQPYIPDNPFQLNQVTEGRNRFSRLGLLVVEIFPDIVKEVLNETISAEELYGKIRRKQRNKPTSLNSFLSHEERQKLCSLKYNNFMELGFSTIYKLIRAFSLLEEPTKGWGMFPEVSDEKISDDIERIRNTRNLIVHKVKADVSVVEMNEHFRTVTEVAHRIDEYLSKPSSSSFEERVRQCKTCSLDAETEQKYLLAVQDIERMKERFQIDNKIYLFYGKSFEDFMQKVREESATASMKEIVIVIQDVDFDETKINILNEMKDQINNQKRTIEFLRATKGSLVMYVEVTDIVLAFEVSQKNEILHFIQKILSCIGCENYLEEQLNLIVFHEEDCEDFEFDNRIVGLDTSTMEFDLSSKSLGLHFSAHDSVFESDERIISDLSEVVIEVLKNNGNFNIPIPEAILTTIQEHETQQLGHDGYYINTKILEKVDNLSSNNDCPDVETEEYNDKKAPPLPPRTTAMIEERLMDTEQYKCQETPPLQQQVNVSSDDYLMPISETESKNMVSADRKAPPIPLRIKYLSDDDAFYSHNQYQDMSQTYEIEDNGQLVEETETVSKINSDDDGDYQVIPDDFLFYTDVARQTTAGSIRITSNEISTLKSDLVTPCIQEYEAVRRIVLIGKTGSGKSATGNSILGKKHFKSTVSSQSVTTECCLGISDTYGRRILVIDTPGLSDTKLSPYQIKKNILNCVHMSFPGPHIFLVVIQIGRFTNEEISSLNELFEIFGEAMRKCSILLFTGLDSLEREQKPFELYIKDSSDPLKQYLSSCENRCFAVNNNASEDIKKLMINNLIQLIDKIVAENEGKVYSNGLFKYAEGELHKAIENAQDSDEHENEDKINKLRLEFEKKKKEFEEQKKHMEKDLHIAQQKQQETENQIKALNEEMKKFKLGIGGNNEDDIIEQRRMLSEDKDTYNALINNIQGEQKKKKNVYSRMEAEQKKKIQNLKDNHKERLIDRIERITDDYRQEINSIFDSATNEEDLLMSFREEKADKQDVVNEKMQNRSSLQDRKFKTKTNKHDKYFLKMIKESNEMQNKLSKKKELCVVM